MTADYLQTFRAKSRTARADTKIKLDIAAPAEIKPLSIISIAATAATMLCGVYKNTTAEIVVIADANK